MANLYGARKLALNKEDLKDAYKIVAVSAGLRHKLNKL